MHRIILLTKCECFCACNFKTDRKKMGRNKELDKFIIYNHFARIQNM